ILERFGIASFSRIDRIDLPLRLQPGDRFLRYTPNGQAPHQFLLAPVTWYRHAEFLTVNPRFEKRWLSPIRVARFELIVRTHQHDRSFRVVSIKVPEIHREGAVRILRPPLENRLDTLTGIELEAERIRVALGGNAMRCNHGVK